MRSLCLLALALAGCGGAPVLSETKTVSVPLATPCIAKADVPVAVFPTDADLAKLADDALIFALALDRLQREGHILKLEALIYGCIKQP